MRISDWSSDVCSSDLAVRATPNGLRNLALAAGFISINWLVYIWAVNSERVVEAALGYYINPLITVALGIVVLGEHLRRLQVVALAFAVAADRKSTRLNYSH